MLPPVTRTKKVRRDGGMGSGGQHRDKRRKGENGITKAEARKEKEERALMVHRLPPGTTQQQLLRVMEKKTHAIATEVEPIEFSGSTGKTQVGRQDVLEVVHFFFRCSGPDLLLSRPHVMMLKDAMEVWRLP